MSVAMGAAGLAAGFFIPLLAQKTAEYKYEAKGRELVPAPRFNGPLLKAGCSVLNAAGWAAAGCYAANWVSPALVALLWTLAVVVAIVDIRIHIIPNEAVLAMAVLGAGLQLALFGAAGLLRALAAMAAVMAAFIVLAAFLGFHAVGAGDVKLAGAMGLALGYPYILHALLGMAALLVVYCAGGIAMKKLTLKSMLPFAPFMMAGMLAAMTAILLR